MEICAMIKIRILSEWLEKTDAAIINNLVLEIIDKFLLITLYRSNSTLAERNYKIFFDLNKNFYNNKLLYPDLPRLTVSQVAKKYNLTYVRITQIYEKCNRFIYYRLFLYIDTGSIYRNDEI
jgi:hypothetical protein